MNNQRKRTKSATCPD